MAAKHPKTPKPRESAPEFPTDGKFLRLVELFKTVVFNEQGNYTRERMSKALEAARASLGEFPNFRKE